MNASCCDMFCRGEAILLGSQWRAESGARETAPWLGYLLRGLWNGGTWA